MDAPTRAAAIEAFATVAQGEVADHVGTPEFGWVRALAIEAFYSDFVAPGVDAVGAWEEIDFSTPLATRLAQGLVVPGDRRRRLDGAAESGGAGCAGAGASDERDRAVRRRGGRLGSGRWGRGGRARRPGSSRAPARVRPAPHRGRLHALGGEGEPRLLVAGPLRADQRRGRRDDDPARRPVRRRDDHGQHEGRAPSRRARPRQVARRRAGSSARAGRRSARPTSRRTTTASRQRLGVRERTDWRKSVHTVEPGFRALGAELQPVRSYTDANCMSCGSCLQGCPTNAGKSTLNTYIHDAWAAGRLELRAEAPRRAGRDRGRGGEGRRVRRRRRVRSTAWTRAWSSSRPARSTRRSSCMRSGLPETPEQPARRPEPRLPSRCGSSTASSTSRRTRTWSTRSRRTRWSTSTTRTEGS